MFIPPLQLNSFLEVIPAWLPVVTTSIGICLLFLGMSHHYLSVYFSHWPAYNEQVGVMVAGCFTASVLFGTYLTIIKSDLALLFIFFTFISGRLIQGAVAARIIQKILDAISNGSSRGAPRGLLQWLYYNVSNIFDYLVRMFKDRLIIFIATGVISTYTFLSIAAVFVIGDGDIFKAIKRFWVGFLLLTIAGLSFDFRHFSHRLPTAAALGLVIATSGAFLYSPVGFSNLTVALSPYISNPIPDWMRLPLGAFGFFMGTLFWSIFYIKE